MYRENDIHQTIDTIQNHFGAKKVSKSIILGTGLSDLLDQFDIIDALPYTQIPHFPVSTAPSHMGKLFLVRYQDELVWILAGRLHYYEGYGMDEITYPILVLKNMDVDEVLITNASGALNPELKASQIVQITDHINLLPENPLRGPSRFGNRFIDMKFSYDHHFTEQAKSIADKQGISLKTGVYVCVQGPTYETNAESRFYRMIGGDVIGMSSVPEVIVARQQGMKVALFSIVTNVHGESDETISFAEILENAKAAIPDLSVLLTELIKPTVLS